MKVFYTIAAVAAASQTMPTQAFAEEPNPEIKAIFETAEEHFNQGDYLKASELYREVLKKKPYWRMYFNIGRCEMELKRPDLAVEAFTAYLAGGGDKITEDRRNIAVEAIGKYKPELASLTFFSETEPLEIFVDDTPRWTTPIEGPLYVMPGEHRVVLKKGDESVFEKTIVIAAGEEVSIERPKPTSGPVVTKESPVPSDTAAVSAPATTPANRQKSPLKPIGITLLVVGTAALIPGIITGAMSISDKNDLEKSCPDKNNCSDEKLRLQDSAKTYATASNILLPIGGVLAVTGIVLTVVGNKKSKRDKAVAFSPLMENHSAGLMIEGRF